MGIGVGSVSGTGGGVSSSGGGMMVMPHALHGTCRHGQTSGWRWNSRWSSLMSRSSGFVALTQTRQPGVPV
jgi:hypothetical protein